jgi:predicted negative regulator of RcsB-dependent stress response
MEELFIYLVIFALGFAFGWTSRETAAKRRVEKFVQQLEEAEESADELIRIKIEKHGEVYYVFSDSDNNEFMAQGSSMKELEDALAKRYPEKRFAATPENLKEMGLV